MAISSEQRVRLSIDVEPELRRQIKIAAALRDISVRDYVEAILKQAAASDVSGWDQPTKAGLMEAEQERGIRALEAMDRIRNELAEKFGTLTPETWELINAARDERTRELMQAAEE